MPPPKCLQGVKTEPRSCVQIAHRRQRGVVTHNVYECIIIWLGPRTCACCWKAAKTFFPELHSDFRTATARERWRAFVWSQCVYSGFHHTLLLYVPYVAGNRAGEKKELRSPQNRLFPRRRVKRSSPSLVRSGVTCASFATLPRASALHPGSSLRFRRPRPYDFSPTPAVDVTIVSSAIEFLKYFPYSPIGGTFMIFRVSVLTLAKISVPVSVSNGSNILKTRHKNVHKYWTSGKVNLFFLFFKLQVKFIVESNLRMKSNY